MEGALVLESPSTDRLLSEPHLDHISQEGAFAASEPMKPWLIGHSSQHAFSRGRRDGEQGSLGSGTQHSIHSLPYPVSCKSGCMKNTFKTLILNKTSRCIFETGFLWIARQAVASTAGEGLAN